MKLRFLVIVIFSVLHVPLAAQELYPLSEPASTIPKGALGVRIFSETYKEVRQWRNMSALRLMYGVSPRLSLYLTGIASNHHGRKMPSEYPFHNTPERGANYPFRFNGAHIYGKYRFVSLDGPGRHLRLAAYADAAWVSTTHHESEPDIMMGDNSGVGGGLIITYLLHRTAVSFTGGAIFPAVNKGLSPDPIDVFPDVPVRTRYGKAFNYSLSAGYLLFPRRYHSYHQTNLNLYLELRGKIFDAARVTLFDGMPAEYILATERYPAALQRGAYMDISPGAQLIFNSNLRLDCSVTFSSLGTSYARLYPVFNVALQRYFFPANKK
jgi:hypothetical protein